MWNIDNWVDFTMANDKIYRLDYESDSRTGIKQTQQLKEVFNTPTFYKDFEANLDFPENGYRLRDELLNGDVTTFRIGSTKSGFNYRNRSWSAYIKENPPKQEAIDYFLSKGLSKNFIPAYWYGKKYDSVDKKISWKIVDLAHNYNLPKVVEDYLVKYPDYVPYYATSFGDPQLQDYVDVYVQLDRRFVHNWDRRYVPGVIGKMENPNYEEFFRNTEEYCRSNNLHCGYTPRGKEMEIFQRDSVPGTFFSGRGEFCFSFVYHKDTLEILKVKTYILKVNRDFCQEYYNNRGYDDYEAF